MTNRKNIKKVIETVSNVLGVITGLSSIFLFLFDFFSSLAVAPIPYANAIICALFAISCFLLVHFIKSKSARQRVFVVVSPFANAAFFASLIQKIVMDLEVHFGFDVVIKIPDSHDKESLRRALRSILDAKKDYVGGIIIPGEHCEPELLKNFSNKFEKSIVLVDRNPFDNEESIPDNMVYVGYESRKGGSIAAKAMQKLIRERGLHDPTILIIGSKEQSQRQYSFKEKMVEIGFDESKIILDNNGDFDRKKAKSIMKRFLQQQTQAQNHSSKAIFCTNDEMALGVNEEIKGNFILKSEDFAVIGYDGIIEAKAVIDTGESAFLNTIIQSPLDLGSKSASVLSQLLEKETTERQIFLNLELYKS